MCAHLIFFCISSVISISYFWVWPPNYVWGKVKIVYLVIEFSPCPFIFHFLITNIFPCARLSNILHFYSFFNVVYQFLLPVQSKVQYPKKTAIVKTPKRSLIGGFMLIFSCEFSFFGATAPLGHGLLIRKVSRSHTMTHHRR